MSFIILRKTVCHLGSSEYHVKSHKKCKQAVNNAPKNLTISPPKKVITIGFAAAPLCESLAPKSKEVNEIQELITGIAAALLAYA